MIQTVENRCSLDTIRNKRILFENGPADATRKAYERKRCAKALTKASMYKMFGLQSVLNDDYRQAYMCNEYLFQNGKKITSNYCRKKCCTVCSRINSAKNLAKYGSRIIDLKDIYLVSLTNVNVQRGELIDEVDRMFLALRRIKVNMRNTYKTKIDGFRSMECTYNWKTGFNPHFHFIVKGYENAVLLRRLWLKQFKNANASGQDIRKVGNTKKDVLEVFKYIAKPVTKGYYSAAAYDEIMRSIKNHRATESLGCIRGKLSEDVGNLDIEDLQSQTITFKESKIEVWRYVHDLYDYVAPTGELLLGTPIDAKTTNSIDAIDRSKVEKNTSRKPDEIMRSSRCQDVVF